jgi:AAHS family 4-hydroxybenzoate transporter-like MFS transporter
MAAFDIAALIDRQPFGAPQRRLLVLFVCASALDGFDLQSIGFLAPYIGKSLNIDMASFGAVFSLGLVGLCLGSVLVPTLANRIGRRPCLLAVLAYIGVLSITTAFVSTRNTLVALRFVTSLGLGGAMPLLAALTAEYIPVRLKALSICLLCAAIPAGGLCAALVGRIVLPSWGWPSVFIVGGMLPLLLAAVFYFVLPTSIGYRGAPARIDSDLAAWAARLWPATPLPLGALRMSAAPTPPSSFRHLFTNSAWRVTVPVWGAFFMGLLVLYFLVNWIPPLLSQASFPPSIGVLAISMFSLGGIVGSIAQDALMRWFGSNRLILIELALVAALVVSLGKVTLTPTVISALTFMIGWSLQGSQAGLNAFIAIHYPDAIRATALGWALGSGRLGSIVGGFLGALALAAGWLPRSILAAAAIPTAICALAFGCAVIGKRSIESQRATNLPLESV